jgi:hypothetical protein
MSIPSFNNDACCNHEHFGVFLDLHLFKPFMAFSIETSVAISVALKPSRHVLADMLEVVSSAYMPFIVLIRFEF